jgi:hypothetical protein
MSNFDYILNQTEQPDQVPQQWVKIISFLKEQGCEAEVMTRIKIKPAEDTNIGKSNKNKAVIQNILLKRSKILSQMLRDDFSLGNIDEINENFDISQLSGSLAEFFDSDESSVDILKMSRREL